MEGTQRAHRERSLHIGDVSGRKVREKQPSAPPFATWSCGWNCEAACSSSQSPRSLRTAPVELSYFSCMEAPWRTSSAALEISPVAHIPLCALKNHSETLRL
ncbi:hypothetical protein SRHO_G00080880 [Serrasalmus rhombeus]